MSDDDKLLYDRAKKALKIGNLEDLALRLNYAKTTSTNWYKSGFNDTVRMKIEKAIAEFGSIGVFMVIWVVVGLPLGIMSYITRPTK